jgi:hypothetical protein
MSWLNRCGDRPAGNANQGRNQRCEHEAPARASHYCVTLSVRGVLVNKARRL